MAEQTKNNFQIPDYTEKADIPGMVRGNIENAEKILGEIKGNISAFDLVLSSMQTTLGTLSDELDEVNGVTAEG